ncbi:unnamed protein product [Mytilus edulis]|uniref:TRPM-like domain-containing protein n=1 Tax=Mytilus edulis TaxID=6550 RepID=A0A8S3TT76_MYTED|nr:unnamed protein product [Mytilus edulis]
MELISLVKTKKSKEAIELIKGGSNLDYVDENGCTCLHYASAGGLPEVIVAAAQHGIDVELRDKDGETALFKAKGQSPLDIAVTKKDAAVIELLCSFGSSVTIDDWALVGVDVDILNKTDQKIMRTLINQLEREAENNYGQQMANFALKMGGEPVTSTVAASRIHFSLAKYIHRNELSVKNKVLAYKEEFDELASDVLDECHSRDPTTAMMIAERRSPTWSNMTSMQMAASADNQTFWHQRCDKQLLISSTWKK